MKSQPYAAFGYVLMRVYPDVGQVVTEDALTNNIFTVQNGAPGVGGNVNDVGCGYVWFLCKGKQSYKNLETGQIIVHEAGWTNLTDPTPPGTYEVQFLTPSEHICFSPLGNSDRTPKIPELEFVEMEQGATRTFPVGTKLYVLEGELQINGNTIPSMRQVRVSSSDVQATAAKKTWGFIFKV
jgi:hypothetical protein